MKRMFLKCHNVKLHKLNKQDDVQFFNLTKFLQGLKHFKHLYPDNFLLEIFQYLKCLVNGYYARSETFELMQKITLAWW